MFLFQILCIIRAIQADVKEFEFEGTTLGLNKNCYVCITMNPGYAGRSELPDNLKVGISVLYVTMVLNVPNLLRPPRQHLLLSPTLSRLNVF